MNFIRRYAVALALFAGLILGSLTSLHAEHEKYSRFFDKHGTAVKVGDVILGAGGEVIKVHGFTSTYKAGTYAAYDYQIQACPTCHWVETLPANGVAHLPTFDKQPSLASRVLAYFDLNAADGDSIMWGS